MSYCFEETNAFMISLSEVERLVSLSVKDDLNRELFLKLSMVSLVTKFQVYIQQVLAFFRESLNGIKSKKLSLHLKMNALRLTVLEGNNLINMKNGKQFTEEKKNSIVDYLKTISFISDEEAVITPDFKFVVKFPLGKTGKKELVDLLTQIDGDETPFSRFEDSDLDNLNSVLQKRHDIVHNDRFNGSDKTVLDDIKYMKNLVGYIDNYLNEKLTNIIT